MLGAEEEGDALPDKGDGRRHSERREMFPCPSVDRC